jgi:hypothetical protein
VLEGPVLTSARLSPELHAPRRLLYRHKNNQKSRQVGIHVQPAWRGARRRRHNFHRRYRRYLRALSSMCFSQMPKLKKLGRRGHSKNLICRCSDYAAKQARQLRKQVDRLRPDEAAPRWLSLYSQRPGKKRIKTPSQTRARMRSGASLY